MTDREFPSIDTSGGVPPPNTVAERGTIALAVLALAGGTLIALGNLLGNDEGPSIASSSPVADTTPRPAASPFEVVVIPSTPPDASLGPDSFGYHGWVRVLADQPIWSSADSNGPSTGQSVRAGQIAYADEETEGWFRIQANPYGFIREADGATRLVEQIAPEPVPVSGEIWALTAGANGFVAVGTPPGDGNSYRPNFVAFSVDGATWQATDLPAFVREVAWGPAGWLAIGSIDPPAESQVWVFRSPDGRHWAPVGHAPGLLHAYQLVGSDIGYMVQANRGRGPGSNLLFSSDGVTWVESESTGVDRRPYEGGHQVIGMRSGFYAWSLAPPRDEPRQAFSANGRIWSTVENGPRGANLRFTLLGDQIVAIGTDLTDGTIRTWAGAIYGGHVVWSPVAPATGLPAGVGLAGLAGNGEHVVALAWQRSSDEPAAWTSLDGKRWTEEPLPTGTFGGIPRLLAGGPTGLVAVGSRPTARGMNPIFWREVDDGSWVPEADPLVDAVPDPSTDACGPPPADMLDFLILDRARAVACLGDAPFTLRAWSLACDGCIYDPPATMEPAWLASPASNQLRLAPIAGEFYGDRGVVHPSLTGDPAWVGTWLELTGHFDDPAAASCRWIPTPIEEEWFSGQRSIVDSCRREFVVTAVTVVDGP